MSGSKEGVIGGVVKLCLFFLFFINGLCKLTPKWGEDIHASMDAAFRERYTPFWQQSLYLSALDVELDPTLVRLMFGSTEMVSAIMLYTRYKIISSIMLFGLMSAVVLTHLFLGEFSEIPMPLVLCFTSLGVCFIGGVDGPNIS